MRLITILGLLSIVSVCFSQPNAVRDVRKGLHIADNGDGTYTNPVMPNAHWSDPSLLRVGNDFYCMTSSIDHSPLMQVLHSKDLVNWNVIGSVTRFWPQDLPPAFNWSPRISYVNGKFRVMCTMSLQYLAAWEADKPEGPYRRIFPNFGTMAFEWAPTIFEDTDGTKYLSAGRWIRKVDNAAMNFEGERMELITTASNPENASIIKKDGYYYVFMGQFGKRVLGNIAEQGFRTSVWRSKKLTGPYEGPRDIITGTNRFQKPNSGSAVLGPDNKWWYVYNTLDMTRITMCRQLHLDPLEWDKDGWPHVNKDRGAGTINQKPVDTFKPQYFPNLNDEFSTTDLEGITKSALGSKWLFKAEMQDAWSLSEKKGWMKMNPLFPSMNELRVSNFLCQRPTGAYYAIETHMIFKPSTIFEEAGIAVKELSTGHGAGIGLVGNVITGKDTIYNLVQWHGKADGWNQVTREAITFPKEKAGKDIYLKMEVNGIVISCFYSFDGADWIQYGKNWFYVYEFAAWRRYWSTFYPGIFSGSTLQQATTGAAYFDYFRHTGYDR